MISAVLSRLIILSFGTLYPAYASYKAMRTKNVKEYVKWMMYWIVYAFFTCIETFTDIFLSWFPFYYEVKVIIVLWLLSPATKGSSILYRKFVHPMLTRREQEIDEYLNQAKERGYSAVLQLGSKGVNYATNVIMQTALKGGGNLVQTIRRSYSLSDLSEPDVHRTQDEVDEVMTMRAQQRILRPRLQTAVGRSASGTRHSTGMYFSEVDVTAKGSSDLNFNIKSSEDISSGYSSAEPMPIGLSRTASMTNASKSRLRTRRAEYPPTERRNSLHFNVPLSIYSDWNDSFLENKIYCNAKFNQQPKLSAITDMKSKTTIAENSREENNWVTDHSSGDELELQLGTETRKAEAFSKINDTSSMGEPNTIVSVYPRIEEQEIPVANIDVEPELKILNEKPVDVETHTLNCDTQSGLNIGRETLLCVRKKNTEPNNNKSEEESSLASELEPAVKTAFTVRDTLIQTSNPPETSTDDNDDEFLDAVSLNSDIVGPSLVDVPIKGDTLAYLEPNITVEKLKVSPKELHETLQEIRNSFRASIESSGVKPLTQEDSAALLYNNTARRPVLHNKGKAPPPPLQPRTVRNGDASTIVGNVDNCTSSTVSLCSHSASPALHRSIFKNIRSNIFRSNNEANLISDSKAEQKKTCVFETEI